MKLVPLFAGLLLSSAQLQAEDFQNAALQQLLQARQAPDGVVFEIMAWEYNSWDWAAPLLRRYVDQLREKYPGLDIVLISQGAELFDLARRAALQETPALRQLAALSAEGVHIYISGDYARWKRLGEKDFVDFVDLAESGSALLDDYIELGFVPIKLEPPDGID
jgi:intracellular sulfur oxidation DsrE/DsrF family protein